MNQSHPSPAIGRWSSRWRAELRPSVYVLLAGALLLLSFPNFRFWPLAPLGLVGFLYSIDGRGFWRGAWLGFLFGCIYQGYLMYWSSFFGLPAVMALTFYRSYPYLALGAALGRLPRANTQGQALAKVLMVTTIWILFEYYQSCGPLGATWGMVGHVLARQTSLIQICSVAGPWALSAALVACSALLAGFVRKECRAWSLALSGFLAFSLWLHGTARLNSAPVAAPVTVGAVQGNMGRDIKWNPDFARQALTNLEEQTRLAAAAGARIIIWPETCIPYRGFRQSFDLTREIGLVGLTTDSYLLVGSLEFAGDEAKHTLNSVSLVSPEGGFDAHYEKQRLVAWGEYLPLEQYCRQFSVFDRVQRFLPGQGNGVLSCGAVRQPQLKSNRQVKLGALICFESMIPDLARIRALAGADILVVPTNDGWFGENSAIFHHFEMGIFRAVESGLPLIQSGNTGISGVIDAYGRPLGETRPNEVAHVAASVPLHNLATPYRRWGDWFPLVLVAISSLSWLATFGRAASQPDSQKAL